MLSAQQQPHPASLNPDQQAVSSFPALVLFILALIVLLVPTLVATPDLLNGVVIDDAFYYFKTARNISMGIGSTFDGIHLSNGYHPLWMIVLVVLFKLFPNGGETPVRFALFLQALMGAMGTVVLYQALSKSIRKEIALLAALIWITWSNRFLVNGLETSLYSLFVVLSLYWWVHHINGNPLGMKTWRYAVFGLILALSCLARIEGVIVAASYTVVLFFQMRNRLAQDMRRFWANFSVYLTLLALPVAAYVLWNYYTFGVLLPVSGSTKLAWRATQDVYTQFSADSILKLLFQPFLQSDHVLVIGIFLSPIAYLLLISRRLNVNTGLAKQIISWLPLLLGSLSLWIFYMVAFWGPHSWTVWYYVPNRVIALVTVAMLAEIIANNIYATALPGRRGFFIALFVGWVLWATWGFGISPLRVLILIFCGFLSFLILKARLFTGEARRWIGFFLAILLLVAVPFMTVLRTMGYPVAVHSPYLVYRGAQWLHNETEPDTIAAAWNAGIIGYYSNRTVINLDGLINSPDYYQRIQKDGLDQYLLDEGVDYIVDCLAWQPETVVGAKVHLQEIVTPVSNLVALDNGCRLRVYHVSRN